MDRQDVPGTHSDGSLEVNSRGTPSNGRHLCTTRAPLTIAGRKGLSAVSPIQAMRVLKALPQSLSCGALAFEEQLQQSYSREDQTEVVSMSGAGEPEANGGHARGSWVQQMDRHCRELGMGGVGARDRAQAVPRASPERERGGALLH